MSTARAHRRAGVLLYASIQFIVLTAIAMSCYAGGTIADPRASGYDFAANFLSDLGATRAWSGAPNHLAAVMFGIALAGVGLAFIAFAGTWRAFAFARGRARIAGLAAQLFGMASGAAFVAVAVTPMNLALDLHNTFVLCAFGFLLGYAASMTVVSWRNGVTRARLATSVAYLVLVCGYLAVVLVVVQTGLGTDRAHLAMVLSQKIVAAGSMLYIAYFTIATRRQLAPC